MALLTSSPSWYIDSGASNHMASIAQNLHSMVPYTGHEQIVAANCQNLKISRIGLYGITTPQNQSLSLTHIYFILNFLLI